MAPAKYSRRSPILGAVVVVAVALVLGRAAAKRCERFGPDVDRMDVALARTTPPLSATPEPLAQRVVVVIVDGLGDTASRDMPVLNRLRSEGASTVARTHLPSSSRPNYVSLLTGVPPEHSGVRTNRYSARVALDSLPRRTRDAGVASVYVTDSADSVATLFPELDDIVYAPWSGGLERATWSVLARDYGLVVLLAGSLDECGHEHRMASASCAAEERAVDAYLGAVASRLDRSRETLIVTADHGHVATGGHGGSEPSVIEVPLVMVGAGVRPGNHADGAQLIDVAPTLAALLGLPAPRHALGVPLIAMLDIPDAARRAMLVQATARVDTNAAVVAAEQSDARAQLRTRSVSDAIWLAVVIAMLAAVIVGLALAGAIHAGGLEVSLGICVLAAAAIGMFAGCDCLGSPSAFSGLDEWTNRALLSFALTLSVLCGGSIARWRLPAREQLARGNAVAWVAITGAGLGSAILDVLARGPFVALPSDWAMFVMLALPPVIASVTVAVAVHRAFDLAIVLVRCAAALPADELIAPTMRGTP